MKRTYETLSLETHLFFGRIMKEHALFLQAGFPSKNADYIQKSNWFRMQFEELLRETVRMSNRRVGEDVLQSNEIVTEFTLGAERRTGFLSGIPIDSRITAAEQGLRAGGGCQKKGCECQNAGDRCHREESEIKRGQIRTLNRKAVRLLNGFIHLKEQILRDAGACRLFTFNYPLLIEHILREARLYRSIIAELEQKGTISEQDMWKTESFWNRIMMEHALFIRGLLDPSEEELILTADGFAEDYRKLLEEAKKKDCIAQGDRTRETLEETLRYRDFKAAGTKGLTECQISGLILPLLADHVLREANHYIRLLEENRTTGGTHYGADEVS